MNKWASSYQWHEQVLADDPQQRADGFLADVFDDFQVHGGAHVDVDDGDQDADGQRENVVELLIRQQHRHVQGPLADRLWEKN